METKELIFKEIKKLPEPYLGEILDFVQFLGTKVMDQRREMMIASESSLKKDWLRPEEDEAWKEL